MNVKEMEDSEDSEDTVLLEDYHLQPEKIAMKTRRLSEKYEDATNRKNDENTTPNVYVSGDAPVRDACVVGKQWVMRRFFAGNVDGRVFDGSDNDDQENLYTNSNAYRDFQIKKELLDEELGNDVKDEHIDEKIIVINDSSDDQLDQNIDSEIDDLELTANDTPPPIINVNKPEIRLKVLNPNVINVQIAAGNCSAVNNSKHELLEIKSVDSGKETQLNKTLTVVKNNYFNKSGPENIINQTEANNSDGIKRKMDNVRLISNTDSVENLIEEVKLLCMPPTFTNSTVYVTTSHENVSSGSESKTVDEKAGNKISESTNKNCKEIVDAREDNISNVKINIIENVARSSTAVRVNNKSEEGNRNVESKRPLNINMGETRGLVKRLSDQDNLPTTCKRMRSDNEELTENTLYHVSNNDEEVDTNTDLINTNTIAPDRNKSRKNDSGADILINKCDVMETRNEQHLNEFVKDNKSDVGNLENQNKDLSIFNFLIRFCVFMKKHLLENLSQDVEKNNAFRKSASLLTDEIQKLNTFVKGEVQFYCPVCSRISTYTGIGLYEYYNCDLEKYQIRLKKCYLCYGFQKIYNSMINASLPIQSNKNYEKKSFESNQDIHGQRRQQGTQKISTPLEFNRDADNEANKEKNANEAEISVLDLSSCDNDNNPNKGMSESINNKKRKLKNIKKPLPISVNKENYAQEKGNSHLTGSITLEGDNPNIAIKYSVGNVKTSMETVHIRPVDADISTFSTSKNNNGSEHIVDIVKSNASNILPEKLDSVDKNYRVDNNITEANTQMIKKSDKRSSGKCDVKSPPNNDLRHNIQVDKDKETSVSNVLVDPTKHDFENGSITTEANIKLVPCKERGNKEISTTPIVDRPTLRTPNTNMPPTPKSNDGTNRDKTADRHVSKCVLVTSATKQSSERAHDVNMLLTSNDKDISDPRADSITKEVKCSSDNILLEGNTRDAKSQDKQLSKSGRRVSGKSNNEDLYNIIKSDPINQKSGATRVNPALSTDSSGVVEDRHLIRDNTLFNLHTNINNDVSNNISIISKEVNILTMTAGDKKGGIFEGTKDNLSSGGTNSLICTSSNDAVLNHMVDSARKEKRGDNKETSTKSTHPNDKNFKIHSALSKTSTITEESVKSLAPKFINNEANDNIGGDHAKTNIRSTKALNRRVSTDTSVLNMPPKIDKDQIGNAFAEIIPSTPNTDDLTHRAHSISAKTFIVNSEASKKSIVASKSAELESKKSNHAVNIDTKATSIVMTNKAPKAGLLATDKYDCLEKKEISKMKKRKIANDETQTWPKLTKIDDVKIAANNERGKALINRSFNNNADAINDNSTVNDHVSSAHLFCENNRIETHVETTTKKASDRLSNTKHNKSHDKSEEDNLSTMREMLLFVEDDDVVNNPRVNSKAVSENNQTKEYMTENGQNVKLTVNQTNYESKNENKAKDDQKPNQPVVSNSINQKSNEGQGQENINSQETNKSRNQLENDKNHERVKIGIESDGAKEVAVNSDSNGTNRTINPEENEANVRVLKALENLTNRLKISTTTIDTEAKTSVPETSNKTIINSKKFYECPICSCIFQNTDSYLSHLKSDHNLNNYGILETLKVNNISNQNDETKLANELTNSASKTSTPLSKGKYVYQCSICKINLYTDYSARSHRKDYHPKLKYIKIYDRTSVDKEKDKLITDTNVTRDETNKTSISDEYEDETSGDDGDTDEKKDNKQKKDKENETMESEVDEDTNSEGNNSNEGGVDDENEQDLSNRVKHGHKISLRKQDDINKSINESDASCDNEGSEDGSEKEVEEEAKEGRNEDSDENWSHDRQNIQPKYGYVCKICKEICQSGYACRVHRNIKHEQMKNRHLFDRILLSRGAYTQAREKNREESDVKSIPTGEVSLKDHHGIKCNDEEDEDENAREVEKEARVGHNEDSDEERSKVEESPGHKIQKVCSVSIDNQVNNTNGKDQAEVEDNEQKDKQINGDQDYQGKDCESDKTHGAKLNINNRDSPDKLSNAVERRLSTLNNSHNLVKILSSSISHINQKCDKENKLSNNEVKVNNQVMHTSIDTNVDRQGLSSSSSSGLNYPKKNTSHEPVDENANVQQGPRKNKEDTKNDGRTVHDDGTTNHKTGDEITQDGSDHITQTKKMPIFACLECAYATDIYDRAIRHCQNHYNDIKDTVAQCTICQLNFDTDYFESHQNLHKEHIRINVVKYSYKSLFFDWDKIFDDIPLDTVKDFREKSIYKTRGIKMAIAESGPWEYSLYQCGQCNTCVPWQEIEQHFQGNCYFVSYPCSICNRYFTSLEMLCDHEKNHSESYRIVAFNNIKHKNFNSKLLEARIKRQEVADKEVIFYIYKCLCGLCFTTSNSFKIHFMDCDSETKEGELCSKCPIPLNFESTELNNHEKLHHSGTKCDLCVVGLKVNMAMYKNVHLHKFGRI